MQIGEVAELLGVTTQTLRNWHNSGKFRACVNPATRHRYYKCEKVREFLAEILKSDETWILQSAQVSEEKTSVPSESVVLDTPLLPIDSNHIFYLRS